MGFKSLIGLVVLVTVVVPRLWQAWTAFGLYNTVYKHAPGKCQLRDEIPHGSEDIQVTSTGLAFISSGLRVMEALNNPKFDGVEGNIFTFDFNKPEEKALLLPIEGDQFDFDDFNPHGISVLETKEKLLLYVVNHHHNLSTSIMKFSYDAKNKNLNHLATIFDENIHYANDVYALEEDVLYYSNYLYTPHPLEMILGLKWHSLGFYDNGKSKLVATKLLIPNGVNMSPDKKFLYVPASETRSIDVYSRKEDNSLELVQQYPMYMFCDNIDVHTETGDLWVGCFPVGLKILQYMADPDVECPPRVMKLSTKDGLITGGSAVYTDDGSNFRGCTIGVRYKNQMLAGAVVTPPLYCELDYVIP